VTDIVPLNELVTRCEFKRTNGGLLPTFSGGAHTIVEKRDCDITRINLYSLMSDPMDQTAYTISVRRDDMGRGGSLFMHKNVKVGDQMVVSNPVNLFSLDLWAKKHLFLVGGIGITPFLAQIKQLERFNGNWELHYACRNAALGSYVDEFTDHYPKETHVYYDDGDQRIDLINLLSGQLLGTHVYVCGPKGMIDWVCMTAAGEGWPRECIHYEEFLSPQSGKPFEVKLAVSNEVIQVGEQESLLKAIERTEVDVPYLCRGGVWGNVKRR
jgi:ferredoxin-NADP reductase